MGGGASVPASVGGLFILAGDTDAAGVDGKATDRCGYYRYCNYFTGPVRPKHIWDDGRYARAAVSSSLPGIQPITAGVYAMVSRTIASMLAVR